MDTIDIVHRFLQGIHNGSIMGRRRRRLHVLNRRNFYRYIKPPFDFICLVPDFLQYIQIGYVVPDEEMAKVEQVFLDEEDKEAVLFGTSSR